VDIHQHSIIILRFEDALPLSLVGYLFYPHETPVGFKGVQSFRQKIGKSCYLFIEDDDRSLTISPSQIEKKLINGICNWSEPLRVDNELSNINSWREVYEKDEAALRPSIQDININYR